MPFQKGQSGNPGGEPKVKPFRDALRMELASANDPVDVPKRSLRSIARALIDRALQEDISAIKEIGDRIDGKVTQPVGGDDEAPSISVAYSWLPITHAPHPSSTTRPEFILPGTTSEPNAGPASSPIAEPGKP